ncbi:hypothetical protein CTAYLR_008246 [Chrysophaeum taylorii]|uniref:Uncharacterized protein n=1 Tax=Chrysophaeum taylorii TaxID=2483200 RepID=A0AAD7UIC6_9STRA|nr:hypothetical protein CTAYLR_008246 [Chrysophaeum taylorii]
MRKFLDLNPALPRDRLFCDVDDSFAAYEAVGFGKIKKVENFKLKVPRLGSAAAWWRYLTNVAALSPVPANLKFGELPEGVLRLGGTFVIEGDRVLFAHADKFPGDHPAVADVLRSLRIPDPVTILS